MKKLILLFITIISFSIFSIKSFASTWKFTWDNTTIHIPVGDSIEKYKDIPKARLFKDGVLLTDTSITYNTEGDWLYYFKDINPYKVGEYQVWYKAYEAKYSPGTCTGYKALITFVVEDTISPTISIISDTVLVHRGSKYDLTKNIIAKDNYKLDEVKIIESIDVNQVGTYECMAVAIDSSKNQATKSFKVLVYENSKPVITASQDTVNVPLNGTYDFKTIFTASDSVDGDISNKIVYPVFDSTNLGTYTYTVSVENNANLKAEYTISVVVVDDEEPTLELNSHSVILEYDLNFNTYDFKQYIKTLSDNVKINYDNLYITHNISNEVGSYIVTYSYTDGIYTVTDELEVTLVSKKKPVIEVMDIELYEYSTIDLYEFINVSDDSDPYVYESVEIDDSAVDYSTEGIYYAEVYACNSSGLSTTQKIKVVIISNDSTTEDNNTTNNNLVFIIISIASSVIALGLLVFIIVFVFLKRKNP